MSCTSSETPEASSASSMATLLHRQARLDSWITCIVPFPTVASVFPQGFATLRFLMAMACGDNPIWNVGIYGSMVCFLMPRSTDPYLSPPNLRIYVCMIHLMFEDTPPSSHSRKIVWWDLWDPMQDCLMRSLGSWKIRGSQSHHETVIDWLMDPPCLRVCPQFLLEATPVISE